MEINQIIANNIKELRKNNKMTQLELGDKIGYSDKMVSKWENGDTIPDVPTLYSIANIFNVTVDYFLHISNKELYIKEKSKNLNKWLVALLGFSIIWLIFTTLFVYNRSLNLFPKSWLAFIWAIPASCIELLVFNKMWGKRFVSLILVSLSGWTTITSIFLQALFSVSRENVWMLFLIGIPLQIIFILLFYIYRK